MATDQLTPADADFAAESVRMRIKRLEKLAKEADELKQTREAASIAGQAAYARDNILPAFRDQAEIPFAGTEELTAGVANVLLDVLRDGRARKVNDAELADLLATRVLRYGRRIAQVSFSHGYNDRDSRIEVQMMQALTALRTDLEPVDA